MARLIERHTRTVEEAPARSVGPAPLALRLAAVLVVPVFLYALYATGLRALDNYRLAQDAATLRGEVRALRDENLRLQEEIHLARTDAAVESIARQELGLVRPGDNAVVLVGAGSPLRAAPPQPVVRVAQPEGPVWQRWWSYFFSPDIP